MKNQKKTYKTFVYCEDCLSLVNELDECLCLVGNEGDCMVAFIRPLETINKGEDTGG